MLIVLTLKEQPVYNINLSDSCCDIIFDISHIIMTMK